MIPRSVRILGILLLGWMLLAPATSLRAAEPQETNWVLGQFAKNIKTPVPLLYDYAEGCPDAGNKECVALLLNEKQLKSRLILGETRGLYRYVYLFSDKSSAYGWIEEKYVTTTKVKPPTSAHWVGTWVTGKAVTAKSSEVSGGTEIFLPNSIVITKGEGGLLSGEGTAFWYGARVTSESGDERAVNLGSFSAQAAHDGTRITFSEGESGCTVKLQLLSANTLFAADNGNCGGMNVHFSGAYTRDDSYNRSSKNKKQHE